jgi:ribose/xylose/arabinose/galactoside ABC-type transport system permease subunit
MSQTLQVQTSISRPGINWPSIGKKLGPFIGLVLVFALFSALRPNTFPTLDNISLMIRLTAVVGTGALGMTLIIISGGIDLSVGAVVGLSTVVIALLANAGFPQPLAVLGGIFTGLASGFVTGNLIIGQLGRVYTVAIALVVIGILASMDLPVGVVWGSGLALLAGGLTVNELFLKHRDFNRQLALIPFIATLGMMTILRGIAHWLGNNGTIDVPGKLWIKTVLIPLHANQSWQIFPAGVWILIVLATAIGLMLRYTRFGRHVYAVGSNEQTARLCGVNVERTKLLVYILGVGCSGIAGLLEFSYLRGSGDSTAGDGMELKMIAAVVIGGASLNGGEGGVMGSMIGALMMTAVNSGCTNMGWNNRVQEIVMGAIIIVASQADRLRHRKAG